jgi:hypothetical protein
MKKVSFLLLSIGMIFFSCANKTRITEGVPDQNSFSSGTPRRAEVLFLGHESKHHNSGMYAPWLAIKLFKSGVI